MQGSCVRTPGSSGVAQWSTSGSLSVLEAFRLGSSLAQQPGALPFSGGLAELTDTYHRMCFSALNSSVMRVEGANPAPPGGCPIPQPSQRLSTSLELQLGAIFSFRREERPCRPGPPVAHTPASQPVLTLPQDTIVFCIGHLLTD